MITSKKIEAAEYRLEELIEVLHYARKNKPAGHFTWEERMAIHQYRAGWFRAFEKLEDYDLKDGIPEAAYAIIEVAEQNQFSDDLERKIQDIVGWLDIRTSNFINP